MLVGRGLEILGLNTVPNSEKLINISENEFQSLESLSFLSEVEEIIADNNLLTENLKLPYMKSLHTLSLNKNKVTELEPLLLELKKQAPALRMLSLLGNPVSPDPIYRHLTRLGRETSSTEQEVTLSSSEFETIAIQMDGKTLMSVAISDYDEEYFRYRLRIIYRLSNLQFLDSTPVSDLERAEAKRRGKYLQPVRIDNQEEVSVPRKRSLVSLVPGMNNWLPALVSPNEPTSRPSYTPLHDVPEKENPKVCYGRNQYEYVGRNSEGNRFIRNFDL